MEEIDNMVKGTLLLLIEILMEDGGQTNNIRQSVFFNQSTNSITIR